MLKNIQRRRTHHSQQVGSYVGSSSDAGKFGVEVEIEKLRKERSVLMQEVVDLQQQQRETVKHAGEVNQRLQSAEQRQKQMVSFLAKLFQNPSFLARLKQKKKEQRGIESPRVRRKFVKQNPSETLKEDQIVRYQPDWGNIIMSSETPELSPVSIEHSPHYLSQDLAREMSVVAEDLTPQIENIESDELAAALPGIMPTPEIFGDGPSSFRLEDTLMKGKNVLSPNQEILPEYFLSFPEVSASEKGFAEFSPLETESMIKQEDLWDPEFNVDVAASSSSGNELWGNHMNYGVSEFGVTSGLSESDMWDIGYGSLGIDQWPVDEIADQPKEDKP